MRRCLAIFVVAASLVSLCVPSSLRREVSWGLVNAASTQRAAAIKNAAGDNAIPEASVLRSGSCVAGLMVDWLSEVASQVRNDVKNGVLHKMSQLRMSTLYKRAKQLVNPTPIEGTEVATKLDRIGEGIVAFVHTFNRVPPSRRAAVYGRVFETSAQLRQLQRKYVNLEAYLSAKATLESLEVLRRLMEELYGALENVCRAVGTATPPPSTPNALKTSSTRLPANSTACSSHSSFVLTNEETVIPELGIFIRNMLLRMKRVFVLAWRFGVFLPVAEALGRRRTIVDYVDELVVFDEELKTFGPDRGVSGSPRGGRPRKRALLGSQHLCRQTERRRLRGLHGTRSGLDVLQIVGERQQREQRAMANVQGRSVRPSRALSVVLGWEATAKMCAIELLRCVGACGRCSQPASCFLAGYWYLTRHPDVI
ncbi:hypothetical protein BESB_026840 [Besnoitia besnoiti]|uniref:Transmembrane protein n=1 Tax=Besnoitia besnoiti TaxID=94643 RepID=A0A2A9M8J8_BESBE|nr:uncharacterized protein BESB_026840 [Besnoitia besnoiti]PFH31710.1 hypothetical protein BESB_026840 [Besnoitia besnoiti]